MSRYDTPTSDFGKLELDGKPKKSTSAMPPTTRSTTSKRRRAASSQPSSGTSGSRQIASRSTARQPIHQPASQQRSLPAQTRLVEDDDGSDDSDDGNEDSEDGNEDNEESEEEARELTPEQLHLRLYEIMSRLTLERVMPWELEQSLTVPEAYSQHTGLVATVGRALFDTLSEQGSLADFIRRFDGTPSFNRRAIMAALINDIYRRFQSICEQLLLYLRDRSGNSVAGTVVRLKMLQHVIDAFLQRYRQHLSGIQKAQVFEIGIRMLVFITCRNSDQYHEFRPLEGDLGPGNLYTEWRAEGEPETLFRLLGSLPVAARYRCVDQLKWLRDALSSRYDIISRLMLQHLPT